MGRFFGTAVGHAVERHRVRRPQNLAAHGLRDSDGGDHAGNRRNSGVKLNQQRIYLFIRSPCLSSSGYFIARDKATFGRQSKVFCDRRRRTSVVSAAGDFDGVISLRPGRKHSLAGGDIHVAAQIHRHAFAALLGKEPEVFQAPSAVHVSRPGPQLGFVGDIKGLPGTASPGQKSGFAGSIGCPNWSPVEKILPNRNDGCPVGRNKTGNRMGKGSRFNCQSLTGRYKLFPDPLARLRLSAAACHSPLGSSA